MNASPPSSFRFAALLLFLGCFATLAANNSPVLSLSTRSRVVSTTNTNDWEAVEKSIQWDATRTAIVVCDMWDKHWCEGATRRVAEMAPRMNAVLKKAREQGLLIIHCPSDTMKFYEGTPGRKLAQAAAEATPKVALQRWCPIDRSKEAPLPIDDSDGGCDDWPQCKTSTAWKQQITAIEIQEGDAITDSAEAYYLMRQRGITNVIVMGVHLNMCVLGRPFSIRQMVSQGQNVLLMRDLTDTMYNSRKPPFVPHGVGTDLMIAHVEKYWCPTISSAAFLGGNEFHFREDKRPHVVMLIGEDEYKTWETLPAFAKDELSWRGLRVSIIQQDKADKNNFPGLVDALRDADLLLVSARRRALPKEQLDAVRGHLSAGKPLIGIRTASHAFAPRGDDTKKGEAWATFDPEVLGGNYNNHHGAGPITTVTMAPGEQANPMLTGVNLQKFVGHGSLYKVSPLAASTKLLLVGTIPGQPAEPVAWTHAYGERKARVFYTSLGHPEDFAEPSFRRLLLNAILLGVGQAVPPAEAKAPNSASIVPPDFITATVPGTTPLNQPGVFWYRCLVKIPANWSGKEVRLAVEEIDSAHEVFFNGTRIGGAGRFPPDYQSGLDAANRYEIPADKLRPGSLNAVAIRIYNHDGRGGFKGEPPLLGTDQQHIRLGGKWQVRTSDDKTWANLPANGTPLDIASYDKVEDGAAPAPSRGHKMADRSTPLPPAEAAKIFTVPDDLEFEQVLAEPIVRQPVFLNFDERGRMWVVQYIQYPSPAGLNVVSKDIFWRAVYDKIPEPPPRGVRGLDKITIHEDTDGDGTFDKHKTFVDGLNIATSCVRGRGGVWVLNPPYLLFYPDRNDDDVPDSDPVVHLAGFGLEDTHSVVNSLRWGPDGWLYAAQGSTVTAKVRVLAPGSADTNKVHYSQGQNIWRYHPETHRYEVFAEGGGNAFGVEIDPFGRIFSGHNGGDTRGFHYEQGAYLRKGFEKHGELSNPYAFGYFPEMKGTKGERFTHNFVLYHGGALPGRYDGKLFGVEPLQGRVVLSEITPDGSTFKTRDIERVVTTSDSWFRPVDIKVGPDGAIYIADWYDRQVSHTRNQEGNIDSSNGRIYRLKKKGAAKMAPIDLGKLPTKDLAQFLNHSNLWFRQQAIRLLVERSDVSILATDTVSRPGSTPLALESLWVLNSSQTPFGRIDGMKNPDPQYRSWFARLITDKVGGPSPGEASILNEAARLETNITVRVQLACSAKRMAAKHALPIISNLLRHDEDAADPRLPLLCWWAIESKCDSDRAEVLKLFEDSTLWSEPMTQQHILERLMRRFAAPGTRRDLLTCARLLDLSPTPEHSEILMRGFEAGIKGRSLAGLPEELITAMARHNVGSPALRLRQGKADALDQALRKIADSNTPPAERLQFIEILGELKPPAALDALLAIADNERDAKVRRAALSALLGYDSPKVPATILKDYNAYPQEVRSAALTLLASRESWSLALAEAADANRIPAASVPMPTVLRMKQHKGGALARLIARQWPKAGNPNSGEMDRQLRHWAEALRSGKGDPYGGQKLFDGTCASCHKLFARGGNVGPDLTTYQRGDVDALLLHVVNPSAEIREGYENFLVETRDERSLNGFLVERDARLLVLRGPDGQNITLEQSNVAELKAAGMSLMPEGLLDNFSDQQVRDLFAYLRSTQPLAN